jgi:hypothetical protein
MGKFPHTEMGLGEKCKFVVLMIALALSLPFSYGGCSDSDSESSSNALRFPPVVFSADKDTAGTIELFAAFNDGNNIIKLSGAMAAGGNVVEFKISPSGLLVAYLADQLIEKFPQAGCWWPISQISSSMDNLSCLWSTLTAGPPLRYRN